MGQTVQHLDLKNTKLSIFLQSQISQPHKWLRSQLQMLTGLALLKEGWKQSIPYTFLKVDITADFIVKACTSAQNKLIIRLLVNDKIINLQNIQTVDQEGPLKANVPD